MKLQIPNDTQSEKVNSFQLLANRQKPFSTVLRTERQLHRKTSNPKCVWITVLLSKKKIERPQPLRLLVSAYALTPKPSTPMPAGAELQRATENIYPQGPILYMSLSNHHWTEICSNALWKIKAISDRHMKKAILRRRISTPIRADIPASQPLCCRWAKSRIPHMV